jgi:hypothetical protein
MHSKIAWQHGQLQMYICVLVCRYYFPVGQVEEWLAAAESRHEKGMVGDWAG